MLGYILILVSAKTGVPLDETTWLCLAILTAVEYTGFVIVEAEDKWDAMDKADNDEEIYEE